MIGKIVAASAATSHILKGTLAVHYPHLSAALKTQRFFWNLTGEARNTSGKLEHSISLNELEWIDRKE